jgi:hypothetical protein
MNKVSQFFNWLARMIRRFTSWWWGIFRKQGTVRKFLVLMDFVVSVLRQP